MPDVRFERVGKHYGARMVIHDFTLTVRDGEFFTLVGPSGCGKSTVLNLVAGLEPVSSGDIYFGDRRITSLSPKDRDVAMVFQSYALYPHKTVYENLAFPLQVRKRHAALIEREVPRVAGLLGLEGLLAKKPQEISGGERQRVAVGRALIREPQVFLMDEPLSNLDAHLRVQTRSEIKRLHARLKTTTLYVTHDQEEALSLSDQIAVLNRGLVQQVGSPMDIYRRPDNTFVARFMGSPQINLLSGRLLTGSSPLLEVGSLRILLEPDPAVPAPPESPSAPQAVLVGIRPEDITVAEPSGSSPLTATVIETEPAGSRTWATVRWDSAEIRAEAPADWAASPNQSVGLTLDARRLHLFDAESGLRLPWQGVSLARP